MQELIVVTGNIHKYDEIKNELSSYINTIQSNIELTEPQSLDMIAISQQKAAEAFQTLWKAVIVDDSWFYMNTYNNFPGTFSKFIYQQLWKNWLHKLLNLENKNAYFQCVISYMDSSLESPISFIWKHEWFIDFDKEDIINPQMPYNSIFISNDWFTIPQHRSRAVQEFIQRFINKTI